MRVLRWLRISTAILTLALIGKNAAAGPQVERIEVVGTEFHLVLADGEVRRGQEIVGAVIRLGGADGLTIRIDSAEIDPLDPGRDIWLYGLSMQTASNTWVNLCTPDHNGVAKGFPLSGSWTAIGEHIPSASAFSLTCTSGASGKCVRMGYKPWRTGPGGASLWDYHQACVRFLRADYCGDGTPHTRPGMLVSVYDRLDIQRNERASGLEFEAAWGAGGAVCLRKTRVPEISTLDEVRRQCPDRAAAWSAEACTEESGRTLPDALMFNAS
jgi:hypothetical protein